MKMTCSILAAAVMPAAFASAQVTLAKIPDGALQPKALTDSSGAAHLLTYRGDARGGDLWYATRPAGAAVFGAAVRVNSRPGSAIAAGTIRGGQFALGRGGQAHVVWNGAATRKREAAPLFYTRSRADGSGFEEQRAMSGRWIMDGGGAVAADPAGNVFVFYHGGDRGQRGEDGRRVLVRISHDSGVTFGEEKIISPDGLGVCACCAMQAFADAAGRLFVVYRTASDGGQNRDVATLFSSDGGVRWKHAIAGRWQIPACPMSSMSIAQTGADVVMAWETEGQIYAGKWDAARGAIGPLVAMPGAAAGRKHPVIAAGDSGRVLVAWTEGTGWNKGGGLAWQMFDAALKPVGAPGRDDGVPVWSFVSAVRDGKSGFTILH